MRRLRRILLNGLIVSSAALCLATIALRVRTQWGRDVVVWEMGHVQADDAMGRWMAMISRDGRLRWAAGWETHKAAQSWDPLLNRPRTPQAVMNYQYFPKRDVEFGDEPSARAGGWGPIRWMTWSYASPGGNKERGLRMYLWVDHWLVALVLAIGPGVWMVAWGRKWRRIRAGRCVECGYDLRGSESGRCSECGEAPE